MNEERNELNSPTGSLPHVGKPEGVDPLTNLLYRNQYGTWTSVMARVLIQTSPSMLGVERIEWITSDEVVILLANH